MESVNRTWSRPSAAQRLTVRGRWPTDSAATSTPLRHSAARREQVALADVEGRTRRRLRPADEPHLGAPLVEATLVRGSEQKRDPGVGECRRLPGGALRIDPRVRKEKMQQRGDARDPVPQTDRDAAAERVGDQQISGSLATLSSAMLTTNRLLTVTLLMPPGNRRPVTGLDGRHGQAD